MVLIIPVEFAFGSGSGRTPATKIQKGQVSGQFHINTGDYTVNYISYFCVFIKQKDGVKKLMHTVTMYIVEAVPPQTVEQPCQVCWGIAGRG